MDQVLQYTIKILVAILLGGLIGAEREARDKSAGFRTMILISVGSALFTMLSLTLSKSDDPTRIASAIVSGIGFLGAGAIVRKETHISGLTTAATIWLVAAVGMASGAGNYPLATGVTFFTLIVLWLFPSLESKIDNLRHAITYIIVFAADMKLYAELEEQFARSGLTIHNKKMSKKDDCITVEWEAFGPPKAHNQLVDTFMKDKRVLEMST